MPLAGAPEVFHQELHNAFHLIGHGSELLVVLIHRIGHFLTQDRRARLGDSVLAQIDDQIELVQIKQGHVLGSLIVEHGDALFCHELKGSACDSRCRHHTRAERLQDIFAIRPGKCLRHLAAA